MLESQQISAEVSNTKRCKPLQGTATNCTRHSRPYFHDLAKFIWPTKTAEELAFRTGTKVRMCRYWLSGEHPAPWSAMSVVFQELIIRLSKPIRPAS